MPECACLIGSARLRACPDRKSRGQPRRRPIQLPPPPPTQTLTKDTYPLLSAVYKGQQSMSAQAPNPVAPPVFEIPRSVDEFGQDGGKFYRCYDALAEEIDEDMAKGLKEQLDGMLIFAGLFAGVNTAFLALTLPLLSADTADDISALLAQNNAILIQVLTGRNDTVPTAAPLPSAGFSPSRDIFIINALFSLSLAFAIISSFLAVLGRQWLVYYRKRSGGGPEKQRWEQLKRFLGAERWQLEPILDDVLPSLLQTGLIIFCVSLILYLRHLSPAISVIVGIPMYIGVAFFIGSAFCTVWDKFCPFQSPLSHVLIWSGRTIHRVLRVIIKLEWRWRMTVFLRYWPYIFTHGRAQDGSLKEWLRILFPRAEGSSLKHWLRDLIRSLKNWLRVLIHGRAEESSKSLQVIALQRAIRTSDDPQALLHATANIFAITDVSQMEHLWSDPSFQDRFIEQLRHAYSRMLQLRGQNQVSIATASQRLYSAAAAHMILSSGSDRDVYYRFKKLITVLEETSVLIPGSKTPNPPTGRIEHGPPFTTLRLLYGYLLLDNTDEDAVETLGTTLNMLVAPGATGPLDRNALLVGALCCVNQSMLDCTIDYFDFKHKFSLLQACERIMRSPQLSRAAQQLIRNIRIELSKYWPRWCSLQ
ncbi:hypothetical protein FRC00_005890 [Tulasnella sp. 408]|nr:hypothetical protein FRC00_005890 [Tulasnella sp. 408]